MRDSVVVYINGERNEIKGDDAFMSVANYLRYKKGLTGTKIVCSEGDCGACTVLFSRYLCGSMTDYKSVNSCISFMYLLDKCSIICVEGLEQKDMLHPIQESMVDCHGAQCGYCTPGFICAMASLAEDSNLKKEAITEKKVKNYTTGNLCRCTGYDAIIKAGVEADLNKVTPLHERYPRDVMENDFSNLSGDVSISSLKAKVTLPTSFNSFVKLKTKKTSITAGATDIGVLVNKGRIDPTEILSTNNIEEAYSIKENKEHFIVGAKASLTDVEQVLLKEHPEFSELIHLFASPQIKNKGTLIGNMMNASPIADTIPFLRVSESVVCLKSKTKVREVNMNDFILGGYKELDIKGDEVVTHIKIPKSDFKFKLYKVSIRKDLDISTVTFACRYKLDGKKVTEFSLALGGVGPTVLRMPKIEKEAIGLEVNTTNFKRLAELVRAGITPLSDIRGTDEYRYRLCHNLLLKFCDEVVTENGFGFVEASL